jgi:UDP-N-acetylmuramoyl-tripeptide--D-alanyl-D-alanine ligase
MRLAKVPRLLQQWMSPHLPREHVFIKKEDRPESIEQKFQVYFRKWIFHPVKRRIAKYYLFILKRISDITVIGITGSAGKTSTKDMLKSILARDGETVASFQNIDPIYNIPSTILKCRPSTKYLILEMGVEYKGEMDFYLWLAEVDVGIITNIYPTHTQFFGSEEGVAKEKLKLVRGLKGKGLAILNKENKYLKYIRLKSKKVYFGRNSQYKISKFNIRKDLSNNIVLNLSESKLSVHMPILGAQFANNALAAATAAKNLGIKDALIIKGLEKFSPPEHRMKPIVHRSGAIILDDTYNNNPQAALRALETLEMVAGKRKKVVVFGDMLELGRLENIYHKKLGHEIAKRDVGSLIGVGKASKILVKEAKVRLGKYAYWADTWKEALPLIKPSLKKNNVILIKGSRSIKLDRLIPKLSLL